MITIRGRLLGALLVASLLSVGLSVPASAAENETSAGFETVLRGTNDYRQLSGVDRLVHDPRMSAVAQAWAKQMSADYASSGDMGTAFRHNPNTGSQIPSGWQAWGENIAMNFGYPQPYDKLLEQWRTSPGHNANMLNSRWTHIGIGTYQDDHGYTWAVQIFGDYGSPASIPDPVDAVIDLDTIHYSGTVACVVLMNQPSGSEFFRQCGTRPGNEYTFSDVPPGSYSVTLLASGGAVISSGLPIGGTLTAHVSLDGGGTAGQGCVGVYTVDYSLGKTVCGSNDIVVKGLAPGNYVVQFQGFTNGGDEWYANVANRSDATLVSIVAGETTAISGSLAPYPMPTGVSPGFGSSSGGTPVTVTGSHFTGATSVTFDGVAGTSLSVDSDTQITVTTPAGTALRAPVVVTTPVGVSVASPSAFFAFLDTSVVAESPVRILDTSGFTSGVVRCYPVVGLAGVPVGATAVLLNVTAVGPAGNGYVVVYPDTSGNGATPAPNSSTVNFEPGKDVANSAMVAIPSDGKVCAYSAGGTLSRLILDVAGYVVPGSGITIQSAQRLLDTRQVAQQVTGPVAPFVVNTVQVTGHAGVPAGATAVLANITVVGPTTEGHLRVWEAGTTVPNTSVVNYAPGQTKANGQIIALSSSGQLSFESFTGVGTATNPVQVIIDVVGYVGVGSQFTATAPTRIVETRTAYGVVGPIPGALVPNTVYPVTLSDTTLIPSTATAVVLNVTAVSPTAFGNLRVYPDTNSLGTTAPPNASVINYIPGRAIPNMVIVQIPQDRKIDFFNNQGLSTNRTDLIVDVIGYIDGPN